MLSAAENPRSAWTTLAARWRLLVGVSVLSGLAALGASFLIPKSYTARTTLIPPQSQQSGLAAGLASLGSVGALAGAGVGGLVKTPADQYVALLQSHRVRDAIIQGYGLRAVYESKFQFEAREELARNTLISVGKKDGLITILVEDHEPQRAADMANRYVDELQKLTGTLAIGEAAQRRKYFQTELDRAASDLKNAQLALQSSGVDARTLRVEPKAAADEYAKLQAEVSMAEIRMAALRNRLNDNAPEVSQQRVILSQLQARLRATTSGAADNSSNSDYVARLRDYKYREALFELLVKQLELARLDESKESPLIQVVDVATPPEWKSSPKRLQFALLGAIAGLLLAAAILTLRSFNWRTPLSAP
ncbi:hypothetical protein CDL60_16565 [Roseateles noduli]|nr:hypothetical protein CDL60_16565 [Roseateles noduli]